MTDLRKSQSMAVVALVAIAVLASVFLGLILYALWTISNPNPPASTDVTITNYGATALVVVVREGFAGNGRELARCEVAAAQGDVWQDGMTSFTRTPEWTLYVNGVAKFSSGDYRARGPNVLIVYADHDGALTVEQEVRL